MRFELQGEEFSYHVFKEILLITGQSWLVVNSVKRSADGSVLQFMLERLKLQRVRRRLMGLFDAPRYDKSKRIQTAVEIRGVKAMAVDDRIGDVDADAVFPILIGLLTDERTMTITSVQEDRGQPFYSMEIVFSRLDIIIADL
jgi:hypothetical protein